MSQQPAPDAADPFDMLTGGRTMHQAYLNMCELALPAGAKVIPDRLAHLMRQMGTCVSKNGAVVAGPSQPVMILFMWWSIVYCDGVMQWFCGDPACAPLRHLRDVAAVLIHEIVTSKPGHIDVDEFVMTMVAEVDMLRPGFG